MGSKERFFYEITSLNPEVTGSCHLVTVHYPNGRQSDFVVDCGLFQEKDYNVLNDMKLPFAGQIIDFALVTHNHADHMSRLPHLVKGGFKGKIYAAEETARLMPLALRDSFKIMKESKKKKNEKCPYDEAELEDTIARIIPCEFDQVEYVDKNIKVTFFMNGHLLGASIILVQISYPDYEDINLVFTGDYKPYNRFFKVNDMPDWVYKLRTVVITEATYGYMDSTQIEYHMEQDVEDYINAGYTILLSGFAQGRVQENLQILKLMQEYGVIDSKIPIRLDGNLGQEYTRMYATSKLLIDNSSEDFLPSNFSFVTKENREEVLNYHRQQIIITTSGMLDHGPAQFYLQKYLSREKVLIYIPGYTSPETLGYKLQHPENGIVTMQGEDYFVRAKVMSTNECSSHAKADEIIDFLQRFENLAMVLVNHGQKDVKNQFALRVEEEVNTEHVGILGEYTFRNSNHGYLKHMGSKWFVPEESSKKSKKVPKKKDKRIKVVQKHKMRRRNFWNIESFMNG